MWENLTWKLIYLPTSPVSCGALPWEIQKSHCLALLLSTNTFFWLFASSQNKTNCNHNCELPTTSENVTALPCKMQDMFVWLKVYCFPPNVDDPLVLCGNLNVRHATTYKVFKVTTLYMDTCYQSFRNWSSASSTRPPRSAEIQPMSQQAAAATRPYSGVVLSIHTLLHHAHLVIQWV